MAGHGWPLLGLPAPGWPGDHKSCTVIPVVVPLPQRSIGGSGGGQSGGDGGHNRETTAAAAAAAYGYGCHQWMGRSGETSAAATALPGNNNNVEVTGGANTSAANASTSAGVKMDISTMSAWAAALQQPEYKDYNG